MKEKEMEELEQLAKEGKLDFDKLTPEQQDLVKEMLANQGSVSVDEATQATEVNDVSNQ